MKDLRNENIGKMTYDGCHYYVIGWVCEECDLDKFLKEYKDCEDIPFFSEHHKDKHSESYGHKTKLRYFEECC